VHEAHTHPNTTGESDWAEAASQGVLAAVDRMVDVAGLRVFGSPATPKFYGSFQVQCLAPANEDYMAYTFSIEPSSHGRVVPCNGMIMWLQRLGDE
jgi:hypothetical protein